jgi:hypothetical protein
MRNEGVGSWMERRSRMSGADAAIAFDGQTLSYTDLAVRRRRASAVIKRRHCKWPVTTGSVLTDHLVYHIPRHIRVGKYCLLLGYLSSQRCHINTNKSSPLGLSRPTMWVSSWMTLNLPNLQHI